VLLIYWNDRVTVGTHFEYMDMGDAKIKNNLLHGDYKTNENYILGINANWKF